MNDREIHDRIMDILEKKIIMGAGVSAGVYAGEDEGGYGTKAGARTRKRTLEYKEWTKKELITKIKKSKQALKRLDKSPESATKAQIIKALNPGVAVRRVVRKENRKKRATRKSVKKAISKAKRASPKKAPSKRRVAKRSASPWIEFVKDYQARHGISYKEALSEAGPSYRAQR